MKKPSLILLLLLVISYLAIGQNGLMRSTPPVEVNSTLLKNAWAGGLNFPQLSEIDLNGDGTKDLFIFDRSGNRILTFINGGHADSVDYHFDPSYITKFPALHDIALLRDFNCDGKEDIFTYSNGGLAVWRNDYTAATGLVFTNLTNLLLSQQGSMYLNLYVSGSNLPSISDLDNDGDLDILTLGVSGGSVELHKNLSMELFGSCDSLKFKMTTSCWGDFGLSSTSNTAFLNAPCRMYFPGTVQEPLDGMHSAATLTALDLDADLDKELLVGDIGFDNLISLTNGGTAGAALMNAQDIDFPQNNLATAAVHLTSMPGAYYLDVDNDGLKDLVVSPSAPNVSENFTSIWFYKNTGTNAQPNFVLNRTNLFQGEMIETGEGNNPAMFDANGDGLNDLIIGNYGYYNSTGNYASGLSYYQNTGSATDPSFKLITRDYATVSAQNIKGVYPTFGDLDADGDKDMLIGDADGLLHFYANVAGAGNAANFVLALANFDSIDVGNNAAPQLVDVDRDGKLDLLIGKRSGKISYHRNIGTTSSPLFSRIATNSAFGGVTVVDTVMSITGYASPWLFDTPGGFKLFVGSERGWVYFYDHIDQDIAGVFNLVGAPFFEPTEGARLSIGGGQIQGDSKPDFILGNYGGGCSLWMNENFTGLLETHLEQAVLNAYPNPADASIRFHSSLMGEFPKTLDVYNLTGQLILSSQFVGEYIQVNTLNFADGMYLCRLKAGTSTSSGKFIVQHRQ